MDFEGRHKSTDTTSLRDLLSRLSTKSGAEDLRADEEIERVTQQREQMRPKKNPDYNFNKKSNFSRKNFDKRKSDFRDREARETRAFYDKLSWDDHDEVEEYSKKNDEMYGGKDETPAEYSKKNDEMYGEWKARRERKREELEEYLKKNDEMYGEWKYDEMYGGSKGRRYRKGETPAEYSKKNDEMYGGSKASRDAYRKFYGLDD